MKFGFLLRKNKTYWQFPICNRKLEFVQRREISKFFLVSFFISLLSSFLYNLALVARNWSVGASAPPARTYVLGHAIGYRADLPLQILVLRERSRRNNPYYRVIISATLILQLGIPNLILKILLHFLRTMTNLSISQNDNSFGFILDRICTVVTTGNVSAARTNMIFSDNQRQIPLIILHNSKSPSYLNRVQSNMRRNSKAMIFFLFFLLHGMNRLPIKFPNPFSEFFAVHLSLFDRSLWNNRPSKMVRSVNNKWKRATHYHETEKENPLSLLYLNYLHNE